MKRIHTNTLRYLLLVLLVIGVAGLILTHQYVTQHQHDQWQNKLKTHATQVAQEIDYELAKFEQIPKLLSHDPRLLEAIDTNNASDLLNQLLANWSSQSLADVIYVHDNTGLVIASSNYQQEDSFVGLNFAFRPYFQNALRGQQAQYVALGVRSNKRGYFFSSPLWVAGQVAGVITVKVNLEPLEQRLSQYGKNVLITDKHNVVFLSNLSDWRYHVLFPLKESAIAELNQTKQYGNDLPIYNGELIAETNITQFNSHQLIVSSHYLLYPTALLDQGFRVISFVKQQQILTAVLQAALAYLLCYALLALIVVTWLQTLANKTYLAEINLHLEKKVVERTLVLSQANQQLQQTIHQYQQSQNELKQTQQELTQAAKLALHGELSASINHEINQPLTALKTYTENSQRLMTLQHYPMVADNLDKMLALNDTIAEVIARLKVFTRKTANSSHSEVTILHDAVHNATSILSNKLIKQGVTLKVPTISYDLKLAIHSVELEQVLINLIHNAAQAMEGHCKDPQIAIAIQCDESICNILVCDNGPGITQDALGKIFDPFFTTKVEGLGLGLTISKRILESYRGSLRACLHQVNTKPVSGMTFVVSVPLVQQVV